MSLVLVALDAETLRQALHLMRHQSHGGGPCSRIFASLRRALEEQDPLEDLAAEAYAARKHEDWDREAEALDEIWRREGVGRKAGRP